MDGTLIVTGHHQGAVLASSIRSAQQSLRAAEGEGYRLELIVSLYAPDDATREVAERAAGSGAQVLSTPPGEGAARNRAVRHAAGEVIVMIQGGDLIGSAWVSASLRRQPRLDWTLRAEQLLIFGPNYDNDAQLLRQRGWEDPSFPAHRLMFERILFGPLAAPRSLMLRWPFDDEFTEHGLGADDWAWLRRTANAGTAHQVAPETVNAIRRRPGFDPLEANIELGGCPSEPYCPLVRAPSEFDR